MDVIQNMYLSETVFSPTGIASLNPGVVCRYELMVYGWPHIVGTLWFAPYCWYSMVGPILLVLYGWPHIVGTLWADLLYLKSGSKLTGGSKRPVMHRLLIKPKSPAPKLNVLPTRPRVLLYYMDSIGKPLR